MLFATDTQRLSNLIKYELFPEFRHCRDVVTYNGVARNFAIGDLVTLTGNVPATANLVYGIVTKNVSAAATTNTQVQVLVRGDAGVSEVGLKLGTLLIADVKTQLLTKNIKVLTAI